MTNGDAPLTRAVFFQVREPKAKLACLAETAAAKFERKEHLLILVEDEKAMQYVDELLWKSPETSFLPRISSKALFASSTTSKTSPPRVNNNCPPSASTPIKKPVFSSKQNKKFIFIQMSCKF